MNAEEPDSGPALIPLKSEYGLPIEAAAALKPESNTPLEVHIVVVCDTSPIRALGYLGLLELLRDFFQVVLVPPGVAAELQRAPSPSTAIDVGDFPFIRVQAPSDPERARAFRDNPPYLDQGESEALALALEVRADLILIDESDGRAKVRALGFVPLGVLGLLIRAKHRGMVKAVTPLIDRLEHELKFHIGRTLRLEIIRMAGEAP